MLKNIQKIFWMFIFYPLFSNIQTPRFSFSKTRKAFIFLLTLTSFTYSQWQQNQFIIGSNLNPTLTYTNITTDTNRIRIAKNAGINLFVVPAPNETIGFDTSGINWTLNLCSQLGMRYLSTDSTHMKLERWTDVVQHSFDLTKAQQVSNFYSSLSATQRQWLYGFNLGDEPSPTEISSSVLPFVRQWVSHFKTTEPNKVSYINLLPVYAYPTGQNASYEQYLDDYLNGPDPNSNPNVTVVDTYLRLNSGYNNRYFYNINIFREKAHSRPYWGHVQVCYIPTTDGTGLFDPDESYIRFSVNSHLAYGYKGIIYYPYCSWDNPITLPDGSTTSKYPWVQKIDAYITNVVGPVIMSSRYLGTYHKANFVDQNNNTIENIPSNQKINNQTPFLKDLSDDKAMAGIFYDEVNNNAYLYIVNKGFGDTHGSINNTVSLGGNFNNKIYTTATVGPNWSYTPVTTTYSNNTTSFTVSNLLPGEGRLYQINNVTKTTTGTLTSDETWVGNITLGGSVTVPSGLSLKINNATIKFPNNTSLFINGTLNVNGTSASPITFTTPSGTGSYGSWGTIELNGPGASGSNISYLNMYYGTEIKAFNVPSVIIQYSHIENTINGINFYGSNGWIVSNVIKNVENHGIIGDGGSTPACYHNTIFKNSTHSDYHVGVGILFANGSHDYIWNNDIRGFGYGIMNIWGSSPQFGHPANSGVNNRITDCIVGLDISYSSNPIVGIEYYSSSYFYGNSIYGNGLAAEVYNNSTVYAHNVYWGSSYYPSYTTDGSSSFYTYPYILSSDPWVNISLPSRVISNSPVLAEDVVSKTASPSSARLISTGSDQTQKRLFEGIAYRDQKKNKEAFNVFVKMIADNEEPEAALVELYNTYSDSTKDDVYNYLKIASQENISIAPHLLSTIHLRRGEIDAAKAVNESIIKKNPNSEDEIHAKIQQLYIALYYEENFALASSLLSDIQKTKNADKNIEVRLAQHTLNSDVNANDADRLKKESKIVEQVPCEFELKQNYPNPFNPTTVISFAIPEAQNVHLAIYDYLGREVAVLLDEFASVGTHEIQFDASKLSTGIYFYKIISGRNVATKKMLLLK